LIASPSDTIEFRRVLQQTLWEWNSVQADDTGVMILPVRWELDATPEMGARPQAILNRQLVDVSDVLVGIFWKRLGTPTAEAESGTAEEIRRFIEAGRPVLIYRCDVPAAPTSLEGDELKRLERFLAELRSNGLIDSFNSSDELQRKVMRALTRTVRDRFTRSREAHPASRGEVGRPVGRLDYVLWRDEETRTAIVDGWVLDPLTPEIPVNIDVMVDGEVLATNLADRPRPDVERRFHLGASHGFAVTIRVPHSGTLSIRAKTNRGEFIIDSAKVPT
jgi:hypothetical protein